MKFSIVINAYNRAAQLARTLESLQFQRHPSFEVIVVNGPSSDGTAALLDRWKDRIVVVDCPETNLSISRNIGIANASGDIVAFLDDDANPEPDWLRRLQTGCSWDRIACVGGLRTNRSEAREVMSLSICY